MADNKSSPVCGINASLDEAKAAIDSLKGQIAAGVNSIGNLGDIAETIKSKLAEVNIPQVPITNLQQELANLPNLSPEAKVAELKQKFGAAMKEAGQDLDEVIGKIPKPAGLTVDGDKDIFAGLAALNDKLGKAFQEAQQQLSQLNIESIVGDICKGVPNLEIPEVTETQVIVDPQNPQKQQEVVVPVPQTPTVNPDPPKQPQKDPVVESKPKAPPAGGFTFAFTADKLQAACGAEAAKWHSYLSEMLPKYNITTPERVAAFCANVTVETNWKLLEENCNYGANFLYNSLNPGKKRFPTLEDAQALVAKGKEAIANVIYGNRMLNGPPETGEGYKYRGRGLKQLTGKDNYTRASKVFFGDDRLVTNPDQVVTDKNIAVETGCWYYKTVNIASYADKKDWGACAALVNLGRPIKSNEDATKIVIGYNKRVELAQKAYNTFNG
jgi:putative chitinase